MLKELCELNGASGYEYNIRNYITKKLIEAGIPYSVDKTGNIIAKSGDSDSKIGLFAHMDEVGFGVKGFTDDGMIKFECIGGILEKILPSHSVVIGDNKIKGVIGNVPKHLKKKGEELKYDDFFIDIGAKSKKEVSEYVRIGEPIYWISEYKEFGDNMIKAKALDDRAGVFILLSILLSKKYSFTAFFTTREEIGIIGAKTVSLNRKLEKAIVFEVTTCADLPKNDEKTTIMGDGVALSILDKGSVADNDFNEEIIKIAKKHKIKFQRKLTVNGGNDAGATTFFGGGIKTAVLSLPGRYIHSPVTVISKNDLQSAKLLAEKILENQMKG